MSEHVLIVGREGGLARRYRQRDKDVTVSVMCRTEYLSSVGSFEDCTRVLALPAEAGIEECVRLAQALHTEVFSATVNPAFTT